jgi:hypothetical protein
LSGALVAAAATVGGGTDEAVATTICVPSVAATCPGNGSAVGKADVEEAMSFEGADGNPDTVLIGSGTFTESAVPFEPIGGSGDTYEPRGSDPLTIQGAGADTTILTSTASANVYIVNLGSNNSRAITMRDLTVQVPAALPDGQGAAFQLDGDTLENVDIVSLNKDSDGIGSEVGPGNVYRGGELRGEAGGSIGDALRGGWGVWGLTPGRRRGGQRRPLGA